MAAPASLTRGTFVVAFLFPEHGNFTHIRFSAPGNIADWARTEPHHGTMSSSWKWQLTTSQIHSDIGPFISQLSVSPCEQVIFISYPSDSIVIFLWGRNCTTVAHPAKLP